MRALLILCLLATATFADDLADLQGTWTCTLLDFDGNVLPEVAAGANKLTITGDKYSVTEEGRGEVEAGTITVDATKTPKWVDFKIDKAPTSAGKVQLGVYTLENGTFTYTVVEPGRADRPKDVKGGKGVMHVAFKKGAASTSASPTTTAPSVAASPATTPVTSSSPSVAASPATTPAASPSPTN